MVARRAQSVTLQALEEWLGQPLFRRDSRGLTPTKAGAVYFKAATQALAHLREATEALPGKAARYTLAVTAAPTFAARILLPRLYSLRQKLPELSLRIDTSHEVVDLPASGFDAAIRLGTGTWDGLESTLLLTESLVPVCAPSLIDRLGAPLDFQTAPLIHLTTVSQDWAAWLGAAGAPDLSRGLVVDSIHLAVAAAIQGLGVAVGRRPLIDSELSAGRLVECGAAVRCRTSYFFVVRARAGERPEVARFREWLLDQTAELRSESQPAACLSA